MATWWSSGLTSRRGHAEIKLPTDCGNVPRIGFSHSLRFASTAKTAKIVEIRSYCAALGKPYVTLHDADIVHALKEVDAAAQAWCTTPDQMVETLRYVLTR